MRLLFFARDRLLGTFFGATAAAGTGFRIDFIMKERLADACRAFFIPDMGFVFIPEI